jgi:coenzyme PQQ precursor peptide PqqA
VGRCSGLSAAKRAWLAVRNRAPKDNYDACVAGPPVLIWWLLNQRCIRTLGKTTMAWTTPTLVEICIGLEINGYLPAEF